MAWDKEHRAESMGHTFEIPGSKPQTEYNRGKNMTHSAGNKNRITKGKKHEVGFLCGNEFRIQNRGYEREKILRDGEIL